MKVRKANKKTILDMAVNAILEELHKAEDKFPGWPEDPIHAVSIMNEECGEATKAALQWTYEGGLYGDLETEITQTGAMALRALINLHKAKRRPSREV